MSASTPHFTHCSRIVQLSASSLFYLLRVIRHPSIFKPCQNQQTQPATMSSEAAPELANAASPSDSASPEPTEHAPAADGRSDDKSKKRAAPNDGAEQPHKVTKRRAARACVSCRARKVRCDVVEGAPCGNCRWDNVEVRAAQLSMNLSRLVYGQWSIN